MTTMGPFARLAESYIERGFSVLPIARACAAHGIKGKAPGYANHLMKDWEQLCDRPMTDSKIESIVRADPQVGIGLACGYARVFGVDVDDKRAVGPVREILGGAHAP